MPTTVFVAPQGRDANPGTAGKPFATIERAQRALREAGGGTAVIHGGTYRLSTPLLFGPEDSNSTYAAAPGETPVLSGGRTITGWRKGAGETWTSEIPGVKSGAWQFNELFVNGERRTRARNPNDGYFHVEKAGPDNRTSFTFKEGDLKPYASLGEAEIVFLHDWSISRVRIAAVNETARTVRLAHPVGPKGAAFWNITGFEPHPRYFVENARELLDMPGEWYLDRGTGVLSYIPIAGEDMMQAEVVAPAIEPLLVVQGDGASGRFVEGLVFKGLTFSHCASRAKAVRYAGGQAGFHEAEALEGMRLRMPAAVRFEGARNCAFEDGRILHVGGTGLSLLTACQDNRIVGNEIADCGGNGVMIGEASKDPKLLAYRNRVENNRVHHCGQLYFGCVGVWVGITDGTVIAHNEIHDLPYTGISLGWQWNWEPTPCRNNRVEFNHIHHVMLILSDGGGIYTLGRQPGTVLRGNFIHAIPPNAGRAESNGMFLDEGTNEILIEGNTIYAVARSPLRFHKAKGDTVARNVLVCARRVPPVRYNATDPATIALVENQVLKADDVPGLATFPRRPGRVGQALRCDGASTFIEVPHAAALDPPHLTLTAWINAAEVPGGDDHRRWIVNKNGNEWQRGHYALMIAGRKAGAYLAFEGGQGKQSQAWSPDDVLKPGRWQHLAMTYDGQVLRVYVDGAEAAAQEVGRARVPGGGPLAIGRRADGYNYFHGLIDEVRLYRRVLAAEEIKALFAAPEAVKPDQDLTGHWSFDDRPEPPAFLEAAEAQAGLQAPYRQRLLRENPAD